MSAQLKFVIALLGIVSLTACATGPSKEERLKAMSLEVVEIFSEEGRRYVANHGEEEFIEKAKEAVRSRMKDPSSVQFRNVRVANYLSGQVLCGEMNAKNGFGAYTGFKSFVAGTSAAHFESTSEIEKARRLSNYGIRKAC